MEKLSKNVKNGRWSNHEYRKAYHREKRKQLWMAMPIERRQMLSKRWNDRRALRRKPKTEEQKQRQREASARNRAKDPLKSKEYQRDWKRRRLASLTPDQLEAYRKERNAYHAAYRKKNRDLIRARKLLPERVAVADDYRKRNREKLNAAANAWRKERKQTHAQYRLSIALRSRLRGVLKGTNKAAHTLEMLGCSLASLKSHLEDRFKIGMDWSNYGYWEIDHIVPLSFFDLTVPENQLKAFHYTNLQPLWRTENRTKHAKLLHTCQPTNPPVISYQLMAE